MNYNPRFIQRTSATLMKIIKREPVPESQACRYPDRGEEKTTYEKQQGNDTDCRNCIVPGRPVSQNEGNEIEQPDGIAQRSYDIDQVDGEEDEYNYYRQANIRCKVAEYLW